MRFNLVDINTNENAYES